MVENSENKGDPVNSIVNQNVDYEDFKVVQEDDSTKLNDLKFDSDALDGELDTSNPSRYACEQEHVIESDLSTKFHNERVLSRHEITYQSPNGELEVVIKNLQTLDEHTTPCVDNRARAWFNDNEIPICVTSHGKKAFVPFIPTSHPLVEERDSNIDLPMNFRQNMMEVFFEFQRKLNSLRRFQASELQPEVKTESQWMVPETDSIHVKGELCTTRGSYTVYYQINQPSIGLICEFQDENTIEAKQLPLLRMAARWHSPITVGDYRISRHSYEKSGLYPVCQAKGCSEPATAAIQSSEGHPHEEWKCCETHYNDTPNGRTNNQREDEQGREWEVRKLKYRCSLCDRVLSHNSILRDPTCHDCPAQATPLPLKPTCKINKV